MDSNNDRNKLKEHFKEIDKNSKSWSDILLGNQFLKLYFCQLGISHSLVVDRLIRLDHLKNKKPHEQFRFAIVRSVENEKNIIKDEKTKEVTLKYSRLDYQHYEKMFEDNKLMFFSKIKNTFEQNEIVIEMNDNSRTKYKFVEDQVLRTNNEKILSLAYSGFFNLYNMEDKENCNFFEKNESQITNFFGTIKNYQDHMMKKKEEHKENQEIKDKSQRKLVNNDIIGKFREYVENKKPSEEYNPITDIEKNYFDHEIICHYAEKLLKIEMNQFHHQTTKKIRSDSKDSLLSQNDYNGNYSIFFVKDEILFEWREFSGELLKVGKNVKSEYLRNTIFDYIKIKNDESEVCYEDDITVFSETTDDPLEHLEASSKNCLLTLILTIIFLINYFFVFPEKTFFEIKKTFMEQFDLLSLTNDPNGQGISEKNILKKSFLNNVYDGIFSKENKNKLNYITDDTKQEILAKNGGTIPNSTNSISQNQTYYLKDVNVFSGMLINFSILKTQNTKSISNKEYSDIPVSTMNYFEIVQDIDDSQSNSTNPYYPISSEIFFPGDLDLQTSLTYRNNNMSYIFEEKINSFVYSLMFYNNDYDALFICIFELEYDSFGNFGNKRFFNAMLPYKTAQSGNFILVIVLSIIIILGMIFLSLGHLSSFINSIFDSINSKSNQLKLEEIFDISVIILVVSSQIYFMINFVFIRDDFPMKITEKEIFIDWLKKLDSINNYQKLTGIAMFFLVTYLLKFFMVAFPSFGIVFHTLRFAYKEIIAYFLLVCLMLGGIGSMAHSSFGYYSPDYTNLSLAYFNVYLMFIGIFDYSSISNNTYSNSLAPYFFTLFMIIFNLILINLFICIVLNNYRDIKEKFLKFNSVYSILMEEKLDDLTTKIWDFFLCKHPQQVEFEMKKKERELKPKFDSDHSNEQNELKLQRLSSVPIWEKISYNFKRLDLKNKLFGDGWDKEEFNSKKKELIQKMEEKELKETIKNYSMDYDSEFLHLGKTLLFVLYIVIFILMIDMQLRLKLPDEVEKDFSSTFDHQFQTYYVNYTETRDHAMKFIRKYYTQNASEIKSSKRNLEEDKNLSENLDLDYINDKKQNVSSGYFFQNSSNISFPNKTETNDTNIISINTNSTDQKTESNEYCKYVIDPLFINNYILLNPPFFRLTFRLFSMIQNPDSETQMIFPFQKKAIDNLDKDSCNSLGEYNDKIEFSDYVAKFTQAGNYDTEENCGGYVLELGKYKLGCNLDDKYYSKTIKSFFGKENLGSFYLSFVLFNLYEDYAVYIRMRFIRNKLGVLEKSFSYYTIPINRYVTGYDFSRAVLECVYLIFSCFYLFFILKGIFKYFVSYFNEDYEEDQNKGMFKDSVFLNKFFRIDFNKFKNEGLLKSFCHMIFILVKKILLAIFWLLQSVFSYLKSDGYNILDFIYFIITLYCLFVWYSILKLTNSINFTQDYDIIDQQKDDNLIILGKLVDKYDTYYFFQSINGFLLFLRILRVFKFSQSINNLMHVIYRAKSTVVFHVLSMIFFNIGFGLAGYAIFSQNIKEFSTLSNSFIQILIFIAGNVNLKLFTDVNVSYGVIFIIMITFCNYLILLNILLSIVVQTFYDVKNDNKMNFGKEIEDDFITKIKSICYNKILLTFERVKFYFHDVEFYNLKAVDNRMQFDKEVEALNQTKIKNVEQASKSRKNVAKMGYYDLFSNMKFSVEELSYDAEKCLQGERYLHSIKKINEISLIDENENNNEKDEISESKKGHNENIGIFEKIFTYIYIVLIDELPDIKKIFEISEDKQYIHLPSHFYENRFREDESLLKNSQTKQKIKNEYIKCFATKFKYEIINKSDSFFKKKFYKKFKEYISKSETANRHNKKLRDEQSNVELYYSKRSREPLENFDFKIYPDEIYKVERIKYNKILNILIFQKNKKKDFEKEIDYNEYKRIDSEDDIGFNDNFKDVIKNKYDLLKHLKFIIMTYDLIVKYYYSPKELEDFEKVSYLSYYLKKFMERQFNSIETRYLNQYISEIKDSLFEQDVKKLLNFDFELTEDNFGDGKNFYGYVIDESLSVRSRHFDNEFQGKLKINNKKAKNNEEISSQMNTIPNNTNNPHNNKAFDEILDSDMDKNKHIYNETENFFSTVNEIFILKKEEYNLKYLGKLYGGNSPIKFLELKERCLKYFSIWNTIFIVFFRKNFKYVRFLEKISYSNYLMYLYESAIMSNDFEENDICFKSHYLYLFSRLFFLEKSIEDNGENSNENATRAIKNQTGGKSYVVKKIDRNIHKYNELKSIVHLDENDSISPPTIFYNDISSYIFDTNDMNYSKNIRDENQKSINRYRVDNRFTQYYPPIFEAMWKNFDLMTKKALFFGIIDKNYIMLDDINSTRIYNLEFYKCFMDESRDYNPMLKIIRFFKSEQRAHLFYFLKFPDEYFQECKKAIASYSKKDISNNELERFKNFESLFKYISESKLNIGYVYNIYNIIFDKLFKEIKIKIRICMTEHDKILEELIKDHKDYFEHPKKRLKFMKFFKYILVLKKYETMISYFTEQINNDPRIADNETGIDKKLEKYELIILILSLDPIDLIEIIRKTENVDIREVYTFLFIYIYSGTKEFESSLAYLNKFIRTDFTIKYEKYGRLLDLKEKFKVYDEKVNIEKNKYEKMVAKKEELNKKFQELEQNRARTINELEKKIKMDPNIQN